MFFKAIRQVIAKKSFVGGLFTVVTLANIFTGCGESAPVSSALQGGSSVNSAGAGNSQSFLVNFPAPTNANNVTFHEGDTTEGRSIPEGLCVVSASGDCLKLGTLDKRKPTVIYIHGWTQDGKTENFVFADKWLKDFNVMLFRWHRRAYEPGFLPISVEPRIWSASNRGEAVIDSLLREYKRMASALGQNYGQEVRLVGHSLGSQVAVGLASRLKAEGFFLLPRRIELLDPAVLNLVQFKKNAFFEKDKSITSDFISASYAFAQSLLSINTYGDVSAVANTKIQRTAIVAYISATGFFDFRFIPSKSNMQGADFLQSSATPLDICVTRDLFRSINTQSLAGGPLNGGDLWAGLDLAERHKRIREYYFESIAFAPPVLRNEASGQVSRAFSATLPTDVILARRGVMHTQQTAGEDTVTISNDVYGFSHKSSGCLMNAKISPQSGEAKLTFPVLRF